MHMKRGEKANIKISLCFNVKQTKYSSKLLYKEITIYKKYTLIYDGSQSMEKLIYIIQVVMKGIHKTYKFIEFYDIKVKMEIHLFQSVVLPELDTQINIEAFKSRNLTNVNNMLKIPISINTTLLGKP